MLKAFITDIDGTLTDDRRRLSVRAVEEIRRIVDEGVPVVLASGNTVCFIDALSKMIGTTGDVIAENGGVYRHGYTGERYAEGNRQLCLDAYYKVIGELQPKGEELRLYSNEYRYSDVAFARDTPVERVREILTGMPVQVVDTGFAIHLQHPGLSKGAALEKLAPLMGLRPENFLATGDSVNDVTMLRAAGIAAVPQNASPEAKSVADTILDKPFGEGTADAIAWYFPKKA